MSEGIFVGAFLSMSSTAVVLFLVFCLLEFNTKATLFSRSISKFLFDQVVKFLVERNSTSSLHGQVTIGILIFQVSLMTFYIYKLNVSLYEVFVSFSNFLP